MIGVLGRMRRAASSLDLGLPEPMYDFIPLPLHPDYRVVEATDPALPGGHRCRPDDGGAIPSWREVLGR